MSPFHHEKRKVFSGRERAEIFSATGERCAKCTRHAGEFKWRHVADQMRRAVERAERKAL